MPRRTLATLLPIALFLALVPISGSAANGTVHGQIIDSDTNLAPNVALQTQACNGGPTCIPGTPSSIVDGTFTISVPAGTYNIRSLSDDPNCGPTAYALANKNSISVGDGGNVNVLLLVTRHKGSVAGQITNSNHQGVTALVVVDSSEQGGFGQGAANTDANGNYVVNCLQAGRGYFVSVFPAQPYLSSSNSPYTVPDSTIPITVNLTVQVGTSHINGNVTCLGLTTGCGGQTAQVLIVQQCPFGCASWVGTTDATTGNFYSGPLAAGSYAIHIFSPNGWDNQAIFNIPVPAGQTVIAPRIGIYMQGQGHSGRLVGNVADAASAPYANCTINAFNTGPAATDPAHGFVTGIVTDANGNYDSGYTLAPGSQWKVYMDCPNHPELSTDTYPNGSRIAIGPQYGVDTATVNFFWPEAPRPYTGGHTAVGIAQPATDAYFAEGFTGLSGGISFHEYLTVQNPNSFSEPLIVDYLLASGTVITKNYNLGAHSRTTINVNADAGPNQNVSAHLHTPLATPPSPPNTFVAERPMYFYYPGGITGGHDAVGAQALASTFYFAEGATLPGFNEYLTVMNPQLTPITIDITYYYGDGGTPPQTITRTIGATTRATYYVNGTADGVGPGHSVSAQISTAAHGGSLFLAERPMYFSALGVTGGSVAVGAPALDSTGNLAEGNTFSFNNEYLTVLSAGASPCTSMQTTYLYGDGTQNKSVTNALTPNGRTTFHVNDAQQAGPGHPVSIHLSCLMPTAGSTFLAERPMYFNFFGQDGGSDAIAVPDSALSQTVYFAEGYTGFHEFLTVLNNNSTDIVTNVTYYLPDGTTKPVNHTFKANARTTISVNTDVGNGTPVSASIDSGSASLKILAERPMYFSF
jgi:hypothetical protein